MNNIKKYFQDTTILYDIANTLLGIVLVILLIIALRNPHNTKAIMTSFFLGGLMNILNGLKNMKISKKKNGTGMTFIIMGIIIIFVGFVITKLYQGI